MSRWNAIIDWSTSLIIWLTRSVVKIIYYLILEQYAEFNIKS